MGTVIAVRCILTEQGSFELGAPLVKRDGVAREASKGFLDGDIRALAEADVENPDRAHGIEQPEEVDFGRPAESFFEFAHGDFVLGVLVVGARALHATAAEHVVLVDLVGKGDELIVASALRFGMGD